MEKNSKEKKKEKKYFDIKVVCNVPAIIHYVILADDADQALKEIKMAKPRTIKYDFEKRIESKATVYDYMTTIIKLVKRVVGRL